jgi:hypothetical protein
VSRSLYRPSFNASVPDPMGTAVRIAGGVDEACDRFAVRAPRG